MLTITKVSENDEQIDELSDDTAEEFTDESTDNTDAETNGLNEEFSNETGEETVDDSIEDDSTEYAEIQEIKEGYFEDLRGSSEYPNTIVDNGKDWERRDIVENAGMRDEFDSIKSDLISEWEANNGVEWPIYDEDVYTDSGSKIRSAGNRYDAHHIQPLTYGDENTASNITPLHALEHYEKKEFTHLTALLED